MAESCAQQAITVNPSSSFGYGLLGQLAMEKKSYPDAYKYFDRAELLSPGLWTSELRDATAAIRGAFRWDTLPTVTDMVGYLDRYVQGQHRAKQGLATAVYNHYLGHSWQAKNILHTDFGRQNLLLFGTSGCGKTYMIELLAKKLGVPLAVISATSLVQTGYVGKKVDSIVDDLLIAADYDIRIAELGIIFIDEIDKIRSNNVANDVSGLGVQSTLLTLLEGRLVRTHIEGKGSFAVDTKAVL
jgi:ATP-dependent protease Clp ATPase subunit